MKIKNYKIAKSIMIFLLVSTILSVICGRWNLVLLGIVLSVFNYCKIKMDMHNDESKLTLFAYNISGISIVVYVLYKLINNIF